MEARALLGSIDEHVDDETHEHEQHSTVVTLSESSEIEDVHLPATSAAQARSKFASRAAALIGSVILLLMGAALACAWTGVWPWTRAALLGTPSSSAVTPSAAAPAEAVPCIPSADSTEPANAAAESSISPRFLMPASNLTHEVSLQLCRPAHSLPMEALRTWKSQPQQQFGPLLGGGGGGAEKVVWSDCAVDSSKGPNAPASAPDASWHTYDPLRDSLCSMLISWAGVRGSSPPFLPLALDERLEWKVWEVDVDSAAGEIIIPLLWLQWKESDSGNAAMAPSQLHSVLPYAFELLAAQGMLLCEIHYADGHLESVRPTVVATDVHIATRGLLCPFVPQRLLTGVTLRFDVPPGPPVGWSQSYAPMWIDTKASPAPSLAFGSVDDPHAAFKAAFHLRLCLTTRRRVSVAITSRTLYGAKEYTSPQDVMDFVDYHRRIGVDQFVLFDHDRRMWESELKTDADDASDQEDVHRGRLRHAIASGIVEYDVMPQARGSHQLQEILMHMVALRLKRSATWLLACDIDEYLVLPPSSSASSPAATPELKLYPRSCDNSLWCPSPLADWLRLTGAQGYGSLVIDTAHVMGKSMPVPPEVLEETLGGEKNEMWRQTHDESLMLPSPSPRAKQICPYEPETPEALERIARFHAATDARINTTIASTGEVRSEAVCTSLPYSVRWVLGFAPYYQRDLAGTEWNMRKNAPKSLIRLQALLQAGVHTSSVARHTRHFDTDVRNEEAFFARAHILHFVDQAGQRSWPITRDKNKLAEFWASKPKQYLVHHTLAWVQENIPLPPPTTKELIAAHAKLP